MIRKLDILDDLEDKIEMAVRGGPGSFAHGFLSARLVDFALFGWIDKNEMNAIDDRLEPHGLSNRFRHPDGSLPDLPGDISVSSPKIQKYYIDDIENNIAEAIRNGPGSYADGFLNARLIDFALCSWITKEELDAVNDRLEPHGLSHRFKGSP